MNNFFLFFVLNFLIFFTSCDAVRVIEPVEIQVKIEDGDFKKVVVKEASFANQKITLDETSSSLLRKRTKFNLDPGIYILEWTTEEYKITEGKITQKHKKVIEVQGEDRLINLWIKGSSFACF